MLLRFALLALLICPALSKERATAAEPPATRKTAEPPRTDRYGDALPPGALARMGSVLFYHGLPPTAFAFSPDGKLLAVSANMGWSPSGFIRVLEAATGRQLRRLRGDDSTHALHFSPDGKQLIARGRNLSGAASIKIWDVATGKETRRLKGHALTHDGKVLSAVAADKDSTRLAFSDVATGKELRRIAVPHGRVWDIVFAPDDKTFAGQAGTSVFIWAAATGKELHRLPGTVKNASWLGYSPNGKILACKDGDGTLRLWDAATGKELHRLKGAVRYSRVSPTFSADSKTLATLCKDNTIRRWDVATAKEVGRIKVLESFSWCGAFAPDGKTLVWGADYGASEKCALHLWDLTAGKERLPPGRLLTSVGMVAFSPDGKTLLTAGWHGDRIHFWETATGKELRQFKVSDRYFTEALSPSAQLLARGGRKLQLWNLATGKEVVLRGQPLKEPEAVVFSPQGRVVAVAGDRAIGLWDTATGQKLRAWHGFQVTPCYLAFLDGGKTLLARVFEGDESGIKVWDVATGKLLRKLSHPLLGRTFTAPMTVSADGRSMAVVVRKWDEMGATLRDVRVSLWDLTAGKAVHELRGDSDPRARLPFSKPDVYCLAFSPDGRSLAWAEGEGVVRLWEVATGQERRLLKGHRGAIKCLAFSADSSLLATGSNDHTALVWDLTGRLDNGPSGKIALSAEELRSLWVDLAAKDAGIAYRAACRLLAGRPTLPFLRQQLLPAPLDARQRERLARLIEDLNSPKFAARRKAGAELKRLGELAAPALRAALAAKPSPEVRRRAQEILESLDLVRSPQGLRMLRAVEVLEQLGTPEARELLKALAQGASEARLTQEAKTALQRLAGRGNSPALQPPKQQPPSTDKSVQKHIKALSDADPKVRRRAAEALGKIGPSAAAAIPALVKALGDEDLFLRSAAVRALSRIGKAAVPVLIDALGDANAKVRQDAADALSWIGREAKAAAPKLTGLLKDDVLTVRVEAASALCQIDRKDKAALAVLVEALKQKDLRLTVALKLGRLGPAARSAAPALMEALKDSEPLTRRFIVSALGNIGPGAEVAVPALAAALKDKDEFVRSEALFALGRIGPKAKAAVPALVAALKHADASTRAWAASTLGNIGAAAEPSVTPLIAALTDPDQEVRRNAAFALGFIGRRAKETIPALTAALTDKDDAVRGNTAFSLAQFAAAAKGKEPALTRILRDRALPGLIVTLKDVNERARAAAALALGELGPVSAPAVPGLLTALKDNNVTVRRAVVVTLGKIGPEAKTTLPAVRAALRDRDGAVRVQAALTLWRLDRQKEVAVRTFREALKGTDKRARYDAAGALGEIGPEAEAAVPELEAAWKGMDPDMRLLAALALWRVGRNREAVLRTLREGLRSEGRAGIGPMLAARALGAIGAEAKAALPALRQLAEEAPEQYIRSAAATAVHKIETAVPKPKGQP